MNKDTVLYGKKALFVGDSISAGHYDTETGRAWAGRLAEQYGLLSTNNSRSGWCFSTIRHATNRIMAQINWAKDEQFDLVVLEGGVNDAWGVPDTDIIAPVGEMSETFNVSDYDITTFAGAFEESLYYLREYFPDAQLVYVSMFYMPKAPSHTNRVSDMEEYYEMAEKICQKWGVAYLDLYHDAELSDALGVMQGSNQYLQDPVHPTIKGYDVITPYIAEFLLEILK